MVKLKKKKSPIVEFVDSTNGLLTFEQMVKPSDELLKKMNLNGVEDTEERYQTRVSIMNRIFSNREIEVDELFDLYDKYTETFF